jgi:hypothetical protein
MNYQLMNNEGMQDVYGTLVENQGSEAPMWKNDDTLPKK